MCQLSIQRIKISSLLFAILLCHITASSTEGALLVNGYDSDLHDRFSNSASFIGNPYDWSGVGRTVGGKWGTLISDSYFVMATHNRPANGNVLQFFEDNDPTGAFAEQTVISTTVIAGSDLSLGMLSAPTYTGGTFDIAHYPVLAQPNLGSLIGQDLFVVGQSANTLPANMRLGRNVVTGVETNFSDPALSGSGDIIYYDYDTTAAGVGVDESKATGGDSGGPSFVVVDGQLAIAGVHWFIYSDPDALGAPGSSGSGDTVLSSFTSEIAAAMVGESFSTLTAVPEPTSLVVLMLACGFAGCRRKRRLCVA